MTAQRRTPEETVTLVAEALRAHLRLPDLLSDAQRESDPAHYRQHVLHAQPDGSFSVVALIWLPGQETPVHDHVAWCVTGVYEGQETEQRYLLATPASGNAPAHAGLIPAEETVHHPGEVSGITPPGDIHRVRNTGDGPAISLHVYGADITRLGSSIHRIYA
ncbi:cysteine dioxygenase [Streptomyces wuyuanensis]|uniref:cysteine dioxygenase family protein n=1 Tax=Streptomyces wuyuanensis TaxID=1196353 RepID=UPI003721DF5A